MLLDPCFFYCVGLESTGKSIEHLRRVRSDTVSRNRIPAVETQHARRHCSSVLPVLSSSFPFLSFSYFFSSFLPSPPLLPLIFSTSTIILSIVSLFYRGFFCLSFSFHINSSSGFIRIFLAVRRCSPNRFFQACSNPIQSNPFFPLIQFNAAQYRRSLASRARS